MALIQLVGGGAQACQYACMYVCSIQTLIHLYVYKPILFFNISQEILMCSQILKPLVSGKGNSNPLQYPCLGNPMDREEPGGL